MLLLVIPLALIAALLYAGSDFLEQRAAHRAAHTRSPTARRRPAHTRLGQVWASVNATAHRLVHDRQWFAGWAVGTLAYFVQGAALYLGSVAVVQSLQVTTLLFALPLSCIGRTQRPRLWDWLGGGAVCLGLGILLAVRGSTQGASEAHRGRILFLLLMLAAAVVVLVSVAIVRHGLLRPTLLACAAGAAFASSATLVKLTTTDLTDVGIAGTATDWPGYALALATGTGVVLQQAAFASGRLPTATTAMVVTNPLVGTIVAAIGFGERLPNTAGALTAIAAAGLFIVVGIATLEHSPLLREDEDEPEPAVPVTR